MIRLEAALFLSIVTGASGCVAVPATADLRSAERSIQDARLAGAESDMAAALHLRLADDQLGMARRLASESEIGAARRWADRAEADAQLASTMAREASTRRAARQALEQAEAVAAELDRHPHPGVILRAERKEGR